MKLPLRFLALASLPFLAGLCGGCGAQMSESPAAPAAQSPAPRPALAQSLFSKDATGALSEADLQRVLDARFDVELPARIGVVALAQAFTPEEPANVNLRATVAKDMTDALKGSQHFSSVTDVSTELPNPSGLEGLRTISARYRSRYLLLVSTVREDQSHLNNWAWLYATGVGILLAPGQTVESQGFVQASLFDVKTGTVLYTSMEPFHAKSVTWLIGGEREQNGIDGRAIHDATKHLAKKVLSQTSELERWVREEHAKENRVPVPSAPPADGPAAKLD